MRNLSHILPFAALAVALSGCDRYGDAEFARERNVRAYQSAMDDYRAGRLDAAIGRFREICSREPGHASARFQLACLLQDAKKDYFGAACAYHEYLQQRPDSDKTHLATERLAACERELAAGYLAKSGATADAAALATLQAARASDAKRLDDLSQALTNALVEVAALQDENRRLKDLLKGTAEDEAAATPTAVVRDAKETLDRADEADTANRTADIADAMKLLEEDAREDAAQPPPIAPTPKPVEVAKKTGDKPPPKPAPDHPAEYVVQEGDSLYRIAVRFYGHASAWKRIREANKASITTDGKVRKGQKIVLPK